MHEEDKLSKKTAWVGRDDHNTKLCCVLHYGLHLLSNTSIIITTLRRLDGKQCDSLMLFKLFPEVFGNSKKAKTKSIHCSRKIAPLIVQNWSVV